MLQEQKTTQDIPIYDMPEAKIFIKDNLVYIDDKEYKVVENYKNALEHKSLEERYTALLQKYHYIVGDWGHEQLRLKGFYENNAKMGKDDQKIGTLQDYLREYCAFGCAYFVLSLNGTPEPFIDTTEKIPRRRPKRRKELTNKSVKPVKKEKEQLPKKSKHAFVIRKAQGE